nr:hypothetical protein CFP56_09463 [Quercus suber]
MQKLVNLCENGQKAKTYNSEDSHVVTHRTTNSPVDCLCMAERTGCPVLSRLWSYVLILVFPLTIYPALDPLAQKLDRRWSVPLQDMRSDVMPSYTFEVCQAGVCEIDVTSICREVFRHHSSTIYGLESLVYTKSWVRIVIGVHQGRSGTCTVNSVNGFLKSETIVGEGTYSMDPKGLQPRVRRTPMCYQGYHCGCIGFCCWHSCENNVIRDVPLAVVTIAKEGMLARSFAMLSVRLRRSQSNCAMTYA